MRIAVALDWEETLAKTIRQDGKVTSYEPRPWLEGFLKALNAYPDIHMLGIFTLGMVIPIGLRFLDHWGFDEWHINKFHDEIVILAEDWKEISKDYDKIILVDDDDHCMVVKPLLGGFASKASTVKISRFHEKEEDVLKKTYDLILKKIEIAKIEKQEEDDGF